MALSASNIFNINSGATASNVNGGFFNTANANFPTDATATVATSAGPVISSASYNFVAGDVGAWVYVKAGTNWTPGWYNITGVAANAATVNAAVGAAITLTNGVYGTNTVAGCATVASPTGGTFGVDYSMGTAAILALTDLVSTASTTATSVAAGFRRMFVGNALHLASGTGTPTADWYEIVNFGSTSSVTLDKVSGTYTAGVAKVGGALSLASSDDAVFELAVSSATASAIFNVKGGATYTIGGTVTISAAGNASWPIRVIGYTTKPGDACTGSSRPVFAAAAAVFTIAANWNLYNISFTGTADPELQMGTNSVAKNCKVVNSSGSVRNGINMGTDAALIDCEVVCYRGIAVGAIGQANIINCWIHDSDNGIAISSANSATVYGNIIESCVTYAIRLSGANTTSVLISNNTLFGSVNTTGIGVSLATGCTDIRIINNIISGFVTGISHADTQTVGYDNYNDFFNNDADVSSAATWQKGPNDSAVNPSFTSVGQVTGATATTTSGNHLVQSGATFVTSGVVAGRDYVYVISGTSVGAGIYGIASVDSETQITTDIAITANATADKVFQITTGHNFGIGTAMKALGSPGAFQGGYSTGYLDQGAVQRQESGGATSYCFAG